MSGLIDWLTSAAAADPLLPALLVGLLAALESALVIGGLVPGQTILLAIAAAVGASGQPLWPLFLAATAGAILGDGVSYRIGRRHGARIAGWGPLARRPRLLAAAEEHIRRRGAASIFVARFVPGLRSVVPAAAGILGMTPARFAVANVASAVVWAASHVFGAGLLGGVLADVGGGFAAVLLGAVVAAVLLVWLARLFARLTLPLVGRARAAVHRWAAARDDRASRLVARTLAPDDPTLLLTLLWSGLLVGMLLVFVGLLEDVHEGDPIVAVDLAISRFVQAFRTPARDGAMVFVTMLGDPVVLTSVAVTAIAWLLWRRHFWVALGFALATLLPLAVVPLIKTALGRARPLADLYSGAEIFSFPSGHATNSALLLALLAVLIGGALRGWRRWAVVFACAATAAAIGFSRIYLQAHWPSDVVAGFSFALAIAAAFLLGLGRMRAEDIRPGGLAAVALAAALVAGGAHLATGHGAALARYAPRDLAVEIAAADWRPGGWRKVAPGRVDFKGDVEAPFVVQWVGDSAPLAALLAAAGWRPAPAWSFATLGGLVGAATPLEAVPPIPQLHLGRGAAAVWTRPLGPDARLVFRLWPSDYAVGGETLYVGGIEGERALRPLGLLTTLEESAAPAADVAALAAALRTDAAAAPHALVLDGPR